MIVRNWMRRDPVTVSGDTLVTDAQRVLNDNNLRAIPVVDDGRLRGVVTRANFLRAAEFVTRSQDPYELAFFAKRLKVKDLMVRRPVAVDADDTMEHCLLSGQERGISQFPVVENGAVVGMVSASEIFHLAARVLGAWETWSGLTLAPVTIERGTLGKVAEIVENAGATLESLFSVGEKDGSAKKRKIVVRFQGAPAGVVVAALEKAGFGVVEARDEIQRCRNGEAR